MDRAMLLKMSKEMIKKDLANPLTFDDLKKIADQTESTSSDEEQEVYTKSSLIYFLFNNLNYYNIEDYVMTFGTNIIKLCSNKDGYNCLSRIINGSLEDLLVDISRRVEIELMVHLYDALELFIKVPELFDEKLRRYITKNICEVEQVATLDAAESYQYEQITIPGVITKKKKERANEVFSRTNFYRKESVRKSIRKYVLSNYDEEKFENFITAFNKLLDELDITKYEILQIKNKYTELIDKLYIYVAPIWLEEKEEKEKKDVNQLTLFDYIR